MIDGICIAIVILFFLLCALYVRACEGL